MFRNLRLNIFVYYFLTVSTFLGVLHYFITVIKVENIFLLAVVLLSFITLAGIMISKLSVDPLQEYVKNLQNLSKETLHELNLPISTIMTNIHMLKKNLDNEKDIKRIARVESACSMLQQRYDELDYMIKSQSQNVVEESFFINELIEERVEFLKSVYPNIEFILNLESTQIFNDKIGLSKVIDNLIDNGVKYSPNNNRIDINIKDYELSIQDHGCGMDEVELLQIFDNYYQSNANMQGFGIGLSLVKRFCDNHKILLNIKSTPNIGTTVLLQFKEH